MTEESPNPTDQWTIRTAARPGAPGDAVVTVHLTNGAFGALPPIEVHVDWKPGAELCDAEAYGAWLVGQSAHYLSKALIDHGVALSRDGDPGGERGV